MKDKDQNLIWEAYITELVGDPDDQKHGIPARPNIDADRRAAELRGPDSNEPKHGGSSPNAPDFDPDNEYQNNMRQAVQDLEDLPTNVTWTWTDDGGMMDWLVKRLDFTNSGEWDGTDRSMPEDLQKMSWGQGEPKDKKEVIQLLKNKILQALHNVYDRDREEGEPKLYANPAGGTMNPTDLGIDAVKGVFDNAQQIRKFYQHWKDKREKKAETEPSADEVRGVSPDKPEGFPLD